MLKVYYKLSSTAMSGRGKPRGPRTRNHHHDQKPFSLVARDTAMSFPADSPVLAMFKEVAVMLTDRQDRHERLVKLSRDVTIESKRVIFLLHSAIRKEDTEKAVTEATQRLDKLINGPIKTIGQELENCPPHLHSRAISPGFQEFIEALTLCSLMQNKTIITWPEVQKKFEYDIPDGDTSKALVTMLPQTDFMLGVADLTGELMRRAINSISSGDTEECFFICDVIRDLYTGFLGLYGANRELNRKLMTTQANVSKVEAAAYAVKVRGGEAPPALVLQQQPPAWDRDPIEEQADEGYY